jgi:chromosome segregation ATPase
MTSLLFSSSNCLLNGDDCQGIIPRTVSDVFRAINESAARHSEEMFLVRVSYVELYNNQFRSLLDWSHVKYDEDGDRHGADDRKVFQTARNDKIQVRESKVAGVHLSGPNLRAPVTSAENVLRIIAAGNEARAVGVTNCNEHSSRSHAILTLYVESRASCENDAEVRVGKLHLVDLAGSERLSLSGAEGSTLVETQNINLSLTALGDVLSALSRNATSRANHDKEGSASRAQPPMAVPYRNSKLTHLLKDSLGGNSKTLMIATLQATKESYTHNLMTLMYASRAKRIRNFTAVNRATQGDSGIHQVSTEIQTLKQRLVQRTEEFDRLRDLHSNDAHENQMLRQRLEELGRANENEKKAMEIKVAHVIHNQAGQMALQQRQVTNLQVRLQDELESWQHKCAAQKVEIHNLRNMVTALERVRSGHGATQEEVAEMQGVLEAWQAQATSAQQELVMVSEKLKVVADQRSQEKKRGQQLQRDLDALRAEKVASDAALREEAESGAQSMQKLLDSEAVLKMDVLAAETKLSEVELELRKERGESKAQTLDLQLKIRSLESAVHESQSRYAAVVDTANATAQRLESDLREKHIALRKSTAESDEKTAALQKATTESTEVRGQLATTNAEKERIQARLDQVEPEHQRLRADLRRFQTTVVAMQQDTQTLLQEKIEVAERSQKECAKLADDLATSRLEMAERKASDLKHSEMNLRLESTIVELKDSLRQREAGGDKMQAANKALVEELSTLKAVCQGAVESKNKAVDAVQELRARNEEFLQQQEQSNFALEAARRALEAAEVDAQRKYRSLEEQAEAATNQASASISSLRKELEVSRAIRENSDATARGDREAIQEAHNAAMIALRNQHHAQLQDALNATMAERTAAAALLEKAQAEKEDLAISSAEEKSMLHEELHRKLHDAQLEFDERSCRAAEVLQNTIGSLDAAEADRKATGLRVAVLEAKLQETDSIRARLDAAMGASDAAKTQNDKQAADVIRLEDALTAMRDASSAQRLILETEKQAHQSLKVDMLNQVEELQIAVEENSQLSASLVASQGEVVALQKAKGVLSQRLEDQAAESTALREEIASLTLGLQQREVEMKANVSKIEKLESEIVTFRADILEARSEAESALAISSGTKTEAAALRGELTSLQSIETQLQAYIADLEISCRASSRISVRAAFTILKERASRELLLERSAKSNKGLSAQVESLACTLLETERERDDASEQCRKLEKCVSTLDIELSSNGRDASKRIETLEKIAAEAESERLELRRLFEINAQDLTREQCRKANAFLELSSRLRQSELETQRSEKRCAGLQNDLKGEHATMQAMHSATVDLERRIQKQRAVHFIWRFSERNRSREKRELAVHQQETLQARSQQDMELLQGEIRDIFSKQQAAVHEIAALRESLAMREADRATAHSEVLRLTSEHSEQETALEVQRAKYEQASLDLAEAQRNVSEQKAKADELSGEMALLASEKTGFERRTLELHRSIEASKELQLQHDNLVSSHAKLEQQVVDLESSVAAAMRRENEATFRLRMLHEEVDRDWERHQMELSDADARLRRADMLLLATNKKSQDDSRQRGADNARWQTRAKDLEDEVLRAQELAEGLKREKAKLQDSLVQLAEQLANEKNARAKAASLVAEQNDVENQLRGAKYQVAACEGRASAAQARVDKLSEHLAAATHENAQLHTDCSRARDSLAQAETKWKATEARHQKESVAAQERFKESEEARRLADVDASAARSEIEGLQQQISILVAEKDTWDVRMIDAQAELSSLRQLCTEQGAARDAALEHMKLEKRRTVDQLVQGQEASLAQFQGQLSRAQQKRSDAESRADALGDKLQKVSTNSAAEIASLREELQRARSTTGLHKVGGRTHAVLWLLFQAHQDPHPKCWPVNVISRS